MGHLTNEPIKTLIHCSYLDTLDVSYFCVVVVTPLISGWSINDHALSQVAKHCKMLRHLNVSTCVLLTGAGFKVGEQRHVIVVVACHIC